MARSIRSTTLETRSARLKLPIAGKPAFVRIGAGVALGYRRNQTAGTWVMRVANGKRGNWIRGIGTADDFEDADGRRVLTYWQAQERARGLSQIAPVRPIRVGEALDRYALDLQTRGGYHSNVSRIRAHMTESLAAKEVATLTVQDLRSWRDNLARAVAPPTVNRTCAAFKAALNLVADEHDLSRRAWELGLASLPNSQRARNVILDDATIRALIVAAYRHSRELGLLVEIAATTGARFSQIARLTREDFHPGKTPRLMIPSSRKGHRKRDVQYRPVPITPVLADRLGARVALPVEPLVLRPDGKRWDGVTQWRLFGKIVKECGLDPAKVSMYALRHSNIVRQLLANVPIRVVAANHDTSVAMLERTYSRYIGDHADVLVRGALLDTENFQPT